MVQQKLVLAGLLAVLGFFISPQVFAQSDVIEKRQKLMKANSAASKAIKAAVAKKDYATVEAKAKEIGDNADKVLDLFPKGSTADTSRAKPEIWTKWDKFKEHPGKVKKAASELAEAAKAKDEAAVKTQFKALGSTCGSCHKTFRAKKKK